MIPKNSRLHQNPFEKLTLTVGAIICLGSVCYMGIQEIRRLSAFNEAVPYAARQFGDKKEPLDNAERAEWFSYMGVKEGEKPTREQINKYFYEKRATEDFRRR
jgi:hypothetical protein